MRMYLKATYNAAIRMFRTGDTEEADRLDAENGAILAEIHRRLERGQCDYAFFRRKERISLYTRDTRNGRVRRTNCFLAKSGEWIPTMHHVFRDASEMARDNAEYPHGGYINVCRIKSA